MRIFEKLVVAYFFLGHPVYTEWWHHAVHGCTAFS